MGSSIESVLWLHFHQSKTVWLLNDRKPRCATAAAKPAVDLGSNPGCCQKAIPAFPPRGNFPLRLEFALRQGVLRIHRLFGRRFRWLDFGLRNSQGAGGGIDHRAQLE